MCGWFGITRQAYYQHFREREKCGLEQDLIIGEVQLIRMFHPRMGTRKLHERLQFFLYEHGIKIGRDCLFDLLARNHLLMRKRKRKVYTTNSQHWLRKYPNLVKGIVATRANEIWVSDITYWKIREREHLYVSLVTDAYSRKIVGYQIADNLEAIESIAALQMALRDLGGALGHCSSLTHHSDRGIQYCSSQYVKLLQDHKVGISMTESGDPRDNAIAERVNGIIKNEYLELYDVEDINEAKGLLAQVIKLYNEERPHSSIGNKTPEVVHNDISIKTTKLWKNYYRKKPNIVNQLQD